MVDIEVNPLGRASERRDDARAVYSPLWFEGSKLCAPSVPARGAFLYG